MEKEIALESLEELMENSLLKVRENCLLGKFAKFWRSAQMAKCRTNWGFKVL